ncbi:MAG: sulfur carrier protein ThiS [Candidatus Dormibacteraeota bacterium]|nr:sulfur carrier protein ThiS [Candidatus Dormibacteraeota bacterium]
MPRGWCRGLCGDQALRVIVLQINGKEVHLDGPTPLLAYLDKLGVSPRSVAVEHNGVIIEREAYGVTILGGGDAVEIVKMVGGGAPTQAVRAFPESLSRLRASHSTARRRRP